MYIFAGKGVTASSPSIFILNQMFITHGTDWAFVFFHFRCYASVYITMSAVTDFRECGTF